jgi:hypothetical protein
MTRNALDSFPRACCTRSNHGNETGGSQVVAVYTCQVPAGGTWVKLRIIYTTLINHLLAFIAFYLPLFLVLPAHGRYSVSWLKTSAVQQ